VPIREVVSQISLPIRILLVLAVAVLGAYMLFLRSKPEEVPPLEPANTSVSEPGKARGAAEDAVDTANGQLAQQESVDGVDAGDAAEGIAAKPQTAGAPGAAAAVPAQDLKGLPKPVRRAIRQDKVLVLLFWNEKSADDRAVHKSLAKVRTHGGRVFVSSAPLKQISKYGRIARGVSVEQSPTIVIADRNLKAETLVGYVDPTTINQAVVDTLRNTNGLFTDAYLRKVDRVCVEYGTKIAALPYYYGNGGVRKFDRRLTRVEAAFVQLATELEAVKAPKRRAAFRSAAVADIAAFNGHVARFASAVTPETSVAGVVAAEQRFRTAARPVTKRINKRFDAQGLLRCGSQF
jgi:hypothetical protein